MKPSAAEKSAIQLLEDQGISSPPVPVEDLARGLGADLAYEVFESNISGMLYRSEGRKLIAVNSTHPSVRQRFTVAHEIGHLRLHKGRPVYIDRLDRINWRDGASDLEEIAANAFAAELLMPRKFLQDEVQEAITRHEGLTAGQLVEDLRKKFKVSQQAMGYRLENLGIIDPGELGS
jgi:Zn-dependent peptidase ImmA (M78 family)